MPDSFATALDYVHAAVAQMEARGLLLTASKQALADLAVLGESGAAVERPAAEASAADRSARTETPPLIVEKPAASPMVPRRARSGDAAADLEELRLSVLASPQCVTGGKMVFGAGSPEAEVVFIGDGPGDEEAASGEPFVGLAGQLLTKIIETMGFRREQVYLTNLLKSRLDTPAEGSASRKPTAAEMRASLPFLEEQIAIIQPKVIVALGATVMDGLLGLTDPMARLRGRWHEFKGMPLMATYHPSYLLRNQSLGEKRKVWEDMLLVLERLERPITDKQRAFFLPKR